MLYSCSDVVLGLSVDIPQNFKLLHGFKTRIYAAFTKSSITLITRIDAKSYKLFLQRLDSLGRFRQILPRFEISVEIFLETI